MEAISLEQEQLKKGIRVICRYSYAQRFRIKLALIFLVLTAIPLLGAITFDKSGWPKWPLWAIAWMIAFAILTTAAMVGAFRNQKWIKQEARDHGLDKIRQISIQPLENNQRKFEVTLKDLTLRPLTFVWTPPRGYCSALHRLGVTLSFPGDI